MEDKYYLVNWLIRIVLDNDTLHVSKNYTGQSKNKINPLRFVITLKHGSDFDMIEMVFNLAMSCVLYHHSIISG
ncbi:hypothetical protein GCM10027566_06050 [Arachidicoccus ginsenosidivorans]|uniref:Uncharacterized protein n=1 Tax=Arachidicoccus ginsenosidivorans TaxID=496057 RepID=A0A5B8VRB1_9BACT|nr:hypothetical protein [Arachidicoccus ginsenosidivorans]QEC74020.1 hypothetical protein FSB73_22455 [Arachidicoccus ginsenosidivorans]